jgi:hypothetical protein
MPQADLFRLKMLQQDIQERRRTILDALVLAWQLGRDSTTFQRGNPVIINTQGHSVDDHQPRRRRKNLDGWDPEEGNRG